jgi:H+/Cl- antiporter ClcA
MTAFLTGVTRAPFTSAIIIFEMTDRHSIIFFLLIGGFIANVIANFVSSHSFYDQLKDLYLKDVEEKLEVEKT